jgi:1-acyl-sn-glycerol-3-phosphate acyltransferase
MTDYPIRPQLLKNSFVLKLSRFVFRLAFPLLGGLRVSGSENIPATGPVLLCPNHTTDLDPVVICAATDRKDLNALAKSELFAVPILGTYFHLIGATPVVRDSPDRGALRVAEAILNSGRMLLIFPEGRCSRSGRLQDIQPGAMLLSQRTGAPIIPVGIRGSRNVLPYGTYIPRFTGGGVTARFGKPIDPSSYGSLTHRQAQRRMAQDLRDELARLTGQE